MDYNKAIEKLFSLHTFGIKLGLDNIKNFLNIINNPQDKLKIFHIAGSNGKGSTSSFIASILMEMGKKVGLYTSPHFVRFNERIKINNVEIPNEYTAEFFTKHEDYIFENELTFFEVTTALAFEYFSSQKVDYAVIETGLGGRLDATNVTTPLASVITSISLEHTNVLGETLAEIAFEKGEIIKPNSKAFISLLPEEAERVIIDKCKTVNVPLFKLKDYIVEDKQLVGLKKENLIFSIETLGLKGEYQKLNASLAILVLKEILNVNNFDIIKKGLKDVVKNTGIQGRYEYFYREPDIIFDSAHNLEGVENFLNEFTKETKYRKKYLLFTAMKDKSIKPMLQKLNETFDEIHITEIDYERAAKLEYIEDIAKELRIKVYPESDYIDFIKNFKQKQPNECLVVLGSMYMLGYIKSKI
ncbi:MAG TPA: folylpolyglutamate synthase/dihydrofolate synthase family protein [Ignavibacteriaceae bacterium]|nr:folylpolyglutamate synthase/dihydrofolate synthase family protein [Ignavibacteriaceae bacterium]